MKNKASSSEAVERFFADFDLGSTDHVSSGDSYFDSHNQKESYEELLNDEVHQEAYRRAILANKDLFTDRIILVVGCGLGSAPYVVAEAGAKMVLAQERNQTGRYVPEIARLNDYENIINVRGDVNDPGFTLPYGITEVDIIVSEPMSYLLLHESRIRDVIVARERFLKPGGKMFPNRFTMHLCAVAAPQEYTMWKEFWQDIGGFDFSDPCLRLTLGTPLVCSASHIGCDRDDENGDAWQKSRLTSTSAELFTVDLLTAPADLATWPELLCGEFEISPRVDERDVDIRDVHVVVWWDRDAFEHEHRVDALAVWFDVKFDHAFVPVEYSTGPEAPWTCWQQTILRLPTFSFNNVEDSDRPPEAPAVLLPGSTIRGRIAFCQASLKRRDIDVKISMEDGRGGNINTYYTLQ